jgi:RHS repeat-associated protein
MTCSSAGAHSRCTGKERDAESGNDYFGARYYESSMGRFMSPDWSASPTGVPYASLSDPQTLNLYGYMRNNPLGGTDPTGHCPEDDYACLAAGDGMVGSPFHNETWSKAWNQFKGAVKSLVNLYQAITPTGDNSGPNPVQMMQPSNSDQAAGMVIGPALLSGFGGMATVTASAPAALETESATITTLLSPSDLNAGQAANLGRFEGSLPAGANPTDIHPLPSGGAAFQAEVPGRVPGSSATYEKQVDASGTTMNYTKTTTTPSGDIAHVKVKYQEPQQ